MAAITAPLAKAPIPVQAAEPEPGDYFTDLQWEVLESLIDAVVPAIVVASDGNSDPGSALTANDTHKQLVVTEEQCTDAYDDLVATLKRPPTYDQFKEFLAARPLDNPRFHKQLRRIVGQTPKSVRKRLGGALDLMTRRTGSLLATGYWTPLHQQGLDTREAIIKSWQNAWTPVWPLLAKTFCTLARVSWAPTDPLFHKLSAYTDHVDDYIPGSEVDYRFLQFPPTATSTSHDNDDEEPAVIKTDIVIVGSGCGGGVAAKVLAEAGHKVVVVDKGYYFPPSHLPMAGEAGQQLLYEAGGSLQATNGATSLLAGSCWGGGGTVNWSASLAPQDFVRREWAGEPGGGLAFFDTPAFQESIDRVCETMGVSDEHVRQNHGNRVLLDGAEKLGWHAKACPQNTGGNEHYCGRCSLGCGSGEKQGPAVNWLPAAQKAGAQFIEGLSVSEVLFADDDDEEDDEDEDNEDNEGGSGHEKKKRRAIGVVGRWTARDKNGFVHSPASERVQRTVRIEAKKVIVASGSLNSPLLLMRSGLKNPHIGKNLHIHPCGNLTAAFPEDVKGWEVQSFPGGILTSVVSDFENLDGHGHGVKLEASSMLPHMVLFNLPWHSALQWKTDALKFRAMNAYISIARDRDTGSVFPDPHDGRPVVDYAISDFDRAHTLAGLVALAKLCYAQGAVEIWPAVPGVPSFKRRSEPSSSSSRGNRESSPADDEENVDGNQDPLGDDDPAFQAWLRVLGTANNSPPRAQHASAHQMGTCRMSSSPEGGVVNNKGQVWDTEGLYVADASVFPSASGVNPMITVMAIADWIARGILADQ
ncbi:GMC oxidoreductase [Microdochium trichocladiopsis]|uniref:GMC oxidoreductase n=1 Tax=Microdochium trichocladiopsis TaxID=1682393 RepID=A0A9P8YGH9_9PEZI|nr:GMC oxidoreductase [Microdochium trichocladiopsis]KAH7037665.1 GMC oxidoreductase [Microdochium trichocladiopsis]